MNDIFNEQYDYPIPDPTWDYSDVWHECQQARQLTEKLLNEMAKIENADDNQDDRLKNYIAITIGYLQSALDSFPED